MRNLSARRVFVSLIAVSTALGGAVMGAAASASAHTILSTSSAELGTQNTPYANFLISRYAIANGDVQTAASAMEAAAAADPSSPDLSESAFLIGILNGDIAQAAKRAPAMSKASETAKTMAPLVEVVAAVHDDRKAAALEQIEAALKAHPQDRNAVLMQPYILAMNGKWTQAFDDSHDAALNDSDAGRLLVYLLKSERARLYELHGQPDKAEAIYKELCQPGAASYIFGPDYGAFLERQGRAADARTVWAGIADQTGDAASKAAVKRIDAGEKAPALPDITASLAQALFVSSTIAFSGHDAEMALASLRMSLYLDPTPERARLFLGQVQQALHDDDASDAVWAQIPPQSPFYAEAVLRRSALRRDNGDMTAAQALLDEALSHQPDSLALVTEKASLLHGEFKDRAALDLLQQRVARAGMGDFTWQTWFLEAMIYDGLDNWPKAEDAIKKAQGLNPGRPEILNFLGYGWISHGEHVQEGMDLIRQALNVTPKSGAIIDSLGWGYYKLGDYEQAQSFIEQAVQLEPADPEINEHLGDVYKAMGRNVEAGYEWQRVLTLKTSERQAAEVRRKLEENAAGQRVADAPVKAETTALADTPKAHRP